ncbi:sensor histidine kinase [Streptomyces sp. NBC_01766]|uniref:sensor histidine kinase n=1 Tax=Streptomyces sp. NBC_01766 TaxID=2975936 RepID=UPI002DDA95D1|nr:histidine kinase [Streptomyces sp. NBC_01766]WSC21288.1 histidine kinase [Streptomyces sp. NBC_01766]
MDFRGPARPVWLDLAPGAAVAALGLAATVTSHGGTAGFPSKAVVALGMGAAVALYRIGPAWALALVWLTAGVQVANRSDVALVQLGAVVVAYGIARHGRTGTVWAGGISIPVGAVCAVVYVHVSGPVGVEFNLSPFTWYAPSLGSIDRYLSVMAPLTVPYMIGLLLRVDARYRTSLASREQAEAQALRAEEIAELRAQQTRLAHDVHDVVGHSLTVILAQADSAQSLGDEDVARIREAMATISATARRSLGDVRHVLSAEPGAPSQSSSTMENLIEGVRGGGHDIRSDVQGASRPLPPELDTVACRVLQEMLTNALKHGSSSAPITVLRAWGSDELRIEVGNAVAGRPARSMAGIGLTGMRRRLEAVGGRLRTLRKDDGNGGMVFTVTARMPVGQRGGST